MERVVNEADRFAAITALENMILRFRSKKISQPDINEYIGQIVSEANYV